MRICVSETVAELYGTRLRSLSPEMEIVLLKDDGSLEPEVEQVDVFYLSDDFFGHREPLRRMLALVKQGAITWFHSSSAGIDSFIFQRVLDSGAMMSHSPGLHSRPIAEYVIGAMLQEVKQVRAHYEAQQRHEWTPIVSGELTGKTVGIVGLGGIGQAVALRAKAFEMRVIGTKRSSLRHEHVDAVLAPDQLHELLTASDYVVLAAPLTDATRGMMGAAEFAAMKPSATLINVARGGLIDEPALITALREGQIAGASLDVASQEPLPPDAALWDAPNCLITPHISQGSPHSMSRTSEHFLENLGRFGRGETLLNVVHDTELTAR